MTFASEITAPVVVEVVGYTPPTRGRYDDEPGLCYPGAGESVDLVVKLGDVDVTSALPADVLEALADEARTQLLER